jgi:hypothetical protein
MCEQFHFSHGKKQLYQLVSCGLNQYLLTTNVQRLFGAEMPVVGNWS